MATAGNNTDSKDIKLSSPSGILQTTEGVLQTTEGVLKTARTRAVMGADYYFVRERIALTNQHTDLRVYHSDEEAVNDVNSLPLGDTTGPWYDVVKVNESVLNKEQKRLVTWACAPLEQLDCSFEMVLHLARAPKIGHSYLLKVTRARPSSRAPELLTEFQKEYYRNRDTTVPVDTSWYVLSDIRGLSCEWDEDVFLVGELETEAQANKWLALNNLTQCASSLHVVTDFYFALVTRFRESLPILRAFAVLA
jgi:hypothetical protein